MPNYAPPRNFYEGDGEDFFENHGYHLTASYASNNSDEYEGDDYTRGRSYTSTYGYCGSPKFRYHGLVHDSDTFSIQTPEPNPEIFNYWWPYLMWGPYVQWWHATY